MLTVKQIIDFLLKFKQIMGKSEKIMDFLLKVKQIMDFLIKFKQIMGESEKTEKVKIWAQESKNKNKNG